MAAGRRYRSGDSFSVISAVQLSDTNSLLERLGGVVGRVQACLERDLVDDEGLVGQCSLSRITGSATRDTERHNQRDGHPSGIRRRRSASVQHGVASFMDIHVIVP